MPMRWLAYSRVSSQRIGVIIAVAAAASETRPTRLSALGRSYAELLTRKHPVSAQRTEQLHEYLRRMHLWERYQSLREGPADRLIGREVQLQDLWLCDPKLPSASGAITDQVVDEVPLLCAGLRLIRSRNYTLNDRGRALLLACDTEVSGLRHGMPDTNPFFLSPGAALYSLFVLLEADFDFLQAAYGAAFDALGHQFSRMNFALQLDTACRTLRSRWSRRVRTGDDRQRLAKLQELAKKIEKDRDDRASQLRKTRGGGRTPDQLATVRLEPLVDTGVLDRESRFDYSYRVTDRQRLFFDGLLDAGSADEFIGARLFELFLRARGQESERIRPQEVWGRLLDAYRDLRSAMGYASYREVVALAMARLADEGTGKYFEIDDGVEVLREQQRQSPRSIQFGVARGGGLTYVKISSREAHRG